MLERKNREQSRLGEPYEGSQSPPRAVAVGAVAAAATTAAAAAAGAGAAATATTAAAVAAVFVVVVRFRCAKLVLWSHVSS